MRLALWTRFIGSLIGTYMAGAIFLLNLVVLGIILAIYRSGGDVAVDSLRAMTFRTVVWLVLFLGVIWLARRATHAGGTKNQEISRGSS